jgi:hypothetical protein
VIEVNEDNLSNVRKQASRCFRKKKREYLTDEIRKPESNRKIKYIINLYGCINEFNKGYQHRTNLLKMRGVIYL